MGARHRGVVGLLLVSLSVVLAGEGHFWQLTDLHLDPWYQPGADVETKCRNFTDTSNPKAGLFGDYHCESSTTLLDSWLDFMRSEYGDVEYVFWTGDSSPMNENYPLPSDDLQMSQQRVFDIVQILTDSIQSTFGPNNYTTILPCLGNHEVWRPSVFYGPEDNRTINILHTIGTMWEPWFLDQNAHDDFFQYGFYSSLIEPGLRLISLNTLWCDSGNVRSWAHKNGDGNDIMFSWLEGILAQSLSDGEAVWVIGHVPMSAPNTIPYCSDQWNSLILQYASIIKLQVYGHTHSDFYTVFSDKLGTPKNVLYVCPSLTPESWHKDGANPGARIYTYDKETKEILDYTQYYCNLTKANEEGFITWEVEYSALSDYPLKSLAPSEWQSLTDSLETDTTLFEQVWQHYHIEHASECDEACKADFLCQLEKPTEKQYVECKEKS
ncbi:smpdl3a protein [Pelomyxa schiedti]|nr:smpdl3a protein [Pelomyxa schiedti]